MCVNLSGEQKEKNGKSRPAMQEGGREGGREGGITLVVSAVVERAHLVDPLGALVAGHPRLFPLLEWGAKRRKEITVGA